MKAIEKNLLHFVVIEARIQVNGSKKSLNDSARYLDNKSVLRLVKQSFVLSKILLQKVKGFFKFVIVNARAIAEILYIQCITSEILRICKKFDQKKLVLKG